MAGKQTHPITAIALPSVLSDPVIHPRNEEIHEEVTASVANAWEWPSEEAKKKFISWKLSDVVFHMFPTGEVTRVKLACELLLIGFLMDDWFNHHTFDEGEAVVSRLHVLVGNPSTFSASTNIERMHQSLFTQILAIPDPKGKVVLDKYVESLFHHCDSKRATFNTLRNYLTFREIDVGGSICMALLYWTEDIDLTPAEVSLLEPLEHLANYQISIMNDIFSYDREWAAEQKLGQGAVMVNGVQVMAQEAMVSVAGAKRLCFALVRVWESEFHHKRKEVLGMEGMKDDKKMLRAIDGIEKRITGVEAFSWKTSRYL